MSYVKLCIVLGGAVIIFVGGLVLGKAFFGASQETQVSTEVILTALHNEGFLVSQSHIYTGSVEIDRSTGSLLKDFFVGQTVTAHGTLRVSSGVDLSDVTRDDIDMKKDSIRISVPDVDVYGVELLGSIDVRNTQGIIKRIVDNDDGYNESLQLLKSQAREAAQTEELQKEAYDQATQEITKLLQLVDPTKSVVVEFET